jgi:hypothetical protein
MDTLPRGPRRNSELAQLYVVHIGVPSSTASHLEENIPTQGVQGFGRRVKSTMQLSSNIYWLDACTFTIDGTINILEATDPDDLVLMVYAAFVHSSEKHHTQDKFETISGATCRRIFIYGFNCIGRLGAKPPSLPR